MHRRDINSRQFAFWLQGALEIADLEQFTEQQIIKIRRKLNDIPVRDSYASTVWLILALCQPKDAFTAIKKMQYDLFVHDIDPSYDGDQIFLQEVHDGKITPQVADV